MEYEYPSPKVHAILCKCLCTQYLHSEIQCLHSIISSKIKSEKRAILMINRLLLKLLLTCLSFAILEIFDRKFLLLGKMY